MSIAAISWSSTIGVSDILSFYDELIGAYYATGHAAYTRVAGLGTFDINGPALAQDPGSDSYRWSLYYSIAGAIWIVFRALGVAQELYLMQTLR